MGTESEREREDECSYKTVIALFLIILPCNTNNALKNDQE